MQFSTMSSCLTLKCQQRDLGFRSTCSAKEAITFAILRVLKRLCGHLLERPTSFAAQTGANDRAEDRPHCENAGGISSVEMPQWMMARRATQFVALLNPVRGSGPCFHRLDKPKPVAHKPAFQ